MTEKYSTRERGSGVQTKITPVMIAEMKQMRAAGYKMRQIAEYFGISRNLVNVYITGRRSLYAWKPSSDETES